MVCQGCPHNSIIHNEAETWSAVKPEISANDAASDGRAIKLMVAVGCQLPEHYLSDGDGPTKATASEMSLPTFLKFQRRQHIMRSLLRAVLNRVIQEAQNARVLSKDMDSGYEIVFPEIDVADHQTLANATQILVNALSVAKTQGWISDETAMRLMFQFAGEDIDIHEELARIAGDTTWPSSQEPKVPAGPTRDIPLH